MLKRLTPTELLKVVLDKECKVMFEESKKSNKTFEEKFGISQEEFH